MAVLVRHNMAIGFQRQAHTDATSSRLLFNNGSYGNSAYLCQQSIEKTIKAIMVGFELTEKDGKDLRHMPLVELWSIMGSTAKSLASESTGEKKNMHMCVYNLCNIGKQMFKSSAGPNKITWWKLSLGIRLNTKEKNVLKRFMVDFKNSIGEIIKTLNNMADMINNRRMRKKEGYRSTRKAVKELAARLTECLDKIKQTNKLTNIQEIVKQIEPTLNVVSKEVFLINQQPTIFISRFILLLMWALEFIISILKITPHEDIGRYPIMVDKMDSIDWYKEKKNKLLDLENSIEKARVDLSRRMNSFRWRPSRRFYGDYVQIHSPRN